MKKLSGTFTFVFIITAACAISANAQVSNDNSKISSLVLSYEKALNTSNIEEMLQLFADDAILLLQGAPTSVGKNEVKNFYSRLFDFLDFNLRFTIEEIVSMSAEWAFIRTTTSGTVSILSNNSINPGNGHELFIIKKQSDGNWRIARYAGSSSEK